MTLPGPRLVWSAARLGEEWELAGTLAPLSPQMALTVGEGVTQSWAGLPPRGPFCLHAFPAWTWGFGLRAVPLGSLSPSCALHSPHRHVPPPSGRGWQAGVGEPIRAAPKGEVAVTAAGRGREERGSRLRLCSTLPRLTLPRYPKAHFLPHDPSALQPPTHPRSGRQGAPFEQAPCPGHPAPPPTRLGGRGLPGAMRGQGRKESLSDSRDLDGSYDQLTGESVARGSWAGGQILSPRPFNP